MRRRPCRPRGFTLVEMLVSLTIFGMLAAAGVGVLRASVDSQAAVAAQLGDISGLARTRALLARDIGQAVERRTRGPGGIAPAFAGQADGFALIGVATRLAGGEPRPQLQRIGWRLEGGTLVRLSDGALDGDGAPLRAVLARDVAGLSLRYRGSDGGWRDSWPQPGDAPLPRAIELLLTRSGEPPVRMLFMPPPGSPPPLPDASAEQLP